MANEQERNARLDALQAAVVSYAAKERKNLRKRVDTSKRILRGRTGSERLTQASVQQASELVVDEINDFLTGE